MDDAKLKAFKAQLEASMSEEDKDSGKYVAMAENAPPEYEPILLDIAKEERVHRMHLATILHDINKRMKHNETDPEEMI